ncbi:DNA-processing protein DprA [Shewanella intestini]|uniref:DNA-protecting protein DprA n=1 Tax=Shewanella intestini TaxID=2017544 RepID=A0ABS5I4S7_9GAMM|nr:MULTISPECIES: DNA-processing protein DprA [Shewanella]MBR9728838.1 DNA-protecting protein DprA [Shewanella intestini]MRG37096.1 DNA-protecting protein DprA [Shewanella sp. XMDDZSB0408]
MDVEELRLRLEFEKQTLPLPTQLINKLRLAPDKVEQALSWLNANEHHHIITLSDPLYPPLLAQIIDPPPLLFAKGDISSLLLPSIALVGSRNASPGGIEVANTLAAQLTIEGFSVTSGMALGIDGAAHRGAISAGGSTMAVLGSGLEKIYPQRHRYLYQDIIENGCVISELWPDVGPFAGNFPKRNRIVSGLSVGTVVVEATQKSGSLISARLAMEQNRNVFAVPGSVLSGYHEGCHELIRNGATLVETAADIIEELTSLSHYHLEEVRARHHIEAKSNCSLPFPPLLASVGYETTTIDRVVEHSGQSLDLVLIQMLELELQGWVTAVPGGYVRLKRS